MPPGDDERTVHEQRWGTVMLADISGFTALSERLDPEDVTRIINACFERLEAVVLAHGGIVDEYLGDCIKAVFGFSPAMGEPTAHAVRAALELREALVAFNRDHELPSPLDIHIGLDSGPVVAVVGAAEGKESFSVIGVAARRAGRLEDASDKGEIYVGPETFAATHAEFEYRPVKGLTLDGGASMPVYELVGRKTRRRPTRQSERRHATILFADVLGLDALAERLEALALAQTITACFAALSEAVTEQGGVIDKYTGDGLMALFGIPNAIEHAPRQGVNAAIEIRERLARFNERRGLALGIHVGVNTGLVVAGEIGGRVRRAFSAMGDTVNLAARLKEAAAHDAIYVGPETHRYTRQDFEYRALEPLALKGKERAVQAYELASVSKQVHRTRVEPSAHWVFSALVGRDAEMATLRQQVAAVAAGRGGVVSLVGEAGMGKTRLVAEVVGAAEPLGVAVLQGRCLSIGGSQSFHPFIDLLRQWAGIDEDEAETSAVAKLAGAVAAVVGPQADDVFPFVATLMGLRLHGAQAERVAGIEGDSLEKLIVKSVRDLFQAVGARRPAIVIFEDLHWADRSSLNLLEALLPLGAVAPLLFCHVMRPQAAETGERLLAFARHELAEQHVEIHLQGLDAGQADTLIQNLLDIEDLPASLRRLIAAKAEGNPFYIEEVVRALIDEGAVEYRDGRFRVTEKIEGVVIPGTIHDVIMARVDRLDESKRHLLQVASVIGRSFYHRIIEEIVEREETLDEDLSALKEAQLLAERARHWEVSVGERSFVEELEYVFKHALAQETIYSSVLQQTRRELHGRVAHTVESLFAGRLQEFYGTLSYHYGRAEEPAKAEEYSFKAGEESARAGASSEALTFFEEAGRLYARLHGDGGDRRHRQQIEKGLGLALLNTGQLTACIPHFDRALEYLGERVPRSAAAVQAKFVADILAVLVRLYALGGRPGRAQGTEGDREFFEIMNARARASVTSDPRRIFFDNIGGVRRMNGIDPATFEEACGLYAVAGGMFSFSGVSFGVSRRFLEAAKRCMSADNLSDVFDCRHLEFTINYLEGRWREDDLLDDALIEECIGRGLFWDVQTYLGLACDRLARQGEFAAARRQLARLAELRDGYRYEFAASNHDGELAMLLLEERRLAEARATVERYYAGRHEDALKVLALGTRAKIEVLAGEGERATATLAEAERVVAAASVVPPWHLSAYAAARLLHDVEALAGGAGGFAARRALARRARKSRRYALRIASKVATQRVETYRLAGTLAWLLGRVDEASRWWTQSLAEGERLAAAPERARTWAEIGRRLTAPGSRRRTLDGQDGATYVAQAQSAFARLGLEEDLARMAVESPPALAAAS
jgi:class 3 adenylate cyclase